MLAPDPHSRGVRKEVHFHSAHQKTEGPQQVLDFPRLSKATSGRTRSIPWMLLQRTCLLLPLCQLTGGSPWAWGKCDLLTCGARSLSSFCKGRLCHSPEMDPIWTSWWAGRFSESDLRIQGGPWVVLCTQTWTGTLRKPVAAELQQNTLPGQLKNVAFLQGHFALVLKLGDAAHHQIQMEMETK